MFAPKDTADELVEVLVDDVVMGRLARVPESRPLASRA